MTTQRNLRGTVSGRVQGVGFRYFVSRLARAEGLNGYVRNLPDGCVEFEIGGDADAVARLLAKIRIGPDHARQRHADTGAGHAGGWGRFRYRALKTGR